MRRARLVFLGLIVSLVGFACGDSDSDSGDGPMCGDAPTCGGKLAGSWTLEDACFIVLSQPKLNFCPTAVAELHSKMSEGSVTFEDDVYERHIELETELLLKLPAKCQGEGDEKKECNAFSMQLSNGGTLTCESADNEADGCECTATLMSRFNDSGEYSIRGNRVVLVGEELDYCVQGGKLTLRPSKGIDMSGTPVTSQLQTTFTRND